MRALEDFLHCGRAFGSAGASLRFAAGAASSGSLRSALAAGGPPELKNALLGREPKYAPDRAFDSLHIRIELDVRLSQRLLEGTCATTVRAFRDRVRRLEFDAAEMRIRRASWEGRPCRFRHDGKKLTVILPRALKTGEEGTVTVAYRVVRPRAGMHFIPAGARHGAQAWSQGQPEDSKYWFPCHDAPQEKATTEVVATVPAGFTAVSNGTLVSKERRGGKETFHWRMARPHSVYLVTLAVGRFVELRDRWEDVLVQYYCEKGREADARRGFGKTPQMLDFFSKKIGVPYAYERYAQVAAARFPGGMENTTCTTQTDAALIDARAARDTDFDGLVAHELAHQWFGDLLTCKDWSHAWLNEGFATYFETLFTEHDKGLDEALYENWRYARHYFQEDESRYRRPIVSALFKNPWVLFDRHLYEKGAAVLHMIRYVLRDHDWWRAIRHYVTKHRDGSVETADFITAIREATGRNLQSFFDQWVFKAGYPHFKVRYRWDRAKREALIWMLQSQTAGEEVPVFKLPVEFYFEGRGWEKTFTEEVTGKEHRFRFKLPGEPLQADFDPHRWILKRTEFQKPLALWRRQLTHGVNAVARIEAAHALARWGSAQVVEELESAFSREKFWGARAEIALALGEIRGEAGVQALKGMLRTPHPKVRRSVVEALGKARRAEVARWLRPLLRDSSYNVAAEAARSLGQHRDPSVIPLLAKAAKQDSWWDVVRAGALTGIASVRDPKVLPLLRKSLSATEGFAARAAAARGVASFHGERPAVLQDLVRLLDDPDERIQLTAVSSLGGTGDEGAVSPLEKLRDATANPRVKTYCEEAVSRLRAGGEKKDRRGDKDELSKLRAENARLKATLARN